MGAAAMDFVPTTYTKSDTSDPICYSLNMISRKKSESRHTIPCIAALLIKEPLMNGFQPSS